MVTVSDVRAFLADLPSSLVSDQTIEKAISVAETIVNAYASVEAPPEDYENAILVQAAWITLVSYATVIERSTGEIPPAVVERLRDLRTIAERVLQAVSGTKETFMPPSTMSKALEDEL
mgnify:CR=1 FL=1